MTPPLGRRIRRIRRSGLPPARWRAVIGVTAIAALLGMAGCERRPAAVAAAPLHIPINLKCTTCNDFIRCAPTTAAAGGGTTAPGRPPLLLLRLEPMTFWDQAGTIFLYLLQYIRPWTEGERPLRVYRDTGAARTTEPGLLAKLDTTAAVVTTPLGLIDQRTGAWRSADGAVLGACESMKRRDGFRIVREFLGRPIPGVKR
jgi:hypothetical protein